MIDQAQFTYSPLQKKPLKDGAERNFNTDTDLQVQIYRSLNTDQQLNLIGDLLSKYF